MHPVRRLSCRLVDFMFLGIIFLSRCLMGMVPVAFLHFKYIIFYVIFMYLDICKYMYICIYMYIYILIETEREREREKERERERESQLPPTNC